MKIIIAIFLGFLFQTMAAQQLMLKEPVRFLALGDSYTIGQSVPPQERWPVQLKDSLLSRSIVFDTLQIIATTGWRTDNLINAIMGQNLEDRNFNLVSLLIGVNNQFQGVTISQYTTEFQQLLDSCIRYAGGDTSGVFVVSIPDYAYTPYGQGSNPSQISQGIDDYNEINKTITNQYGITYFNITPISRQGVENPALVASDGLHPSGLQYGLWVEIMMDYLDLTFSTAINPNTLSHEIKVISNPVEDRIVLEIPVIKDTLEYRMLDLQGRMVQQGNLIPVTEMGVIHLSPNFLNGVYILEITNAEGGRWQRKILIRK